MKKGLQVMMAVTHDAATGIFSGQCPFVFLGKAADIMKIYPGQTVLIYEKRRPLYGCAMVVGQAVISRAFMLSGGFPNRRLFRYWAMNVEQDEELVGWIDKIGDFELPHYKKGSIFTMAMYDEEYFEYILKNKALPSTYNDCFYDYQTHPEHGLAREKARSKLIDFDNWLYSVGFYNKYLESEYVAAYQVEHIQMYDLPKPVEQFTMENGKPFTRAPQYLTYALGG